MKEIEVQMAALGKAGVGPGEYALGVGHISLDEEKEAKQHLEAAWAAGERAPELAWALGRTLGMEYARAVMSPPPLDEAGLKARDHDLKERLHSCARLSAPSERRRRHVAGVRRGGDRFL
jgi:hypothetical protein